MKICIVGCGLRTPLLIHGLVNSNLEIDEIRLFDISVPQMELMYQLGIAIAQHKQVRLSTCRCLEEGVAGVSFIISSIRTGGLESRARDERLAIECGCAGQETTGPAGFSMAIRTIPEALELARTVEQTAPSGWIINFTNPAGLITQAMTKYSKAKIVGICDTPTELIYQISRALNIPMDNLACDYVGLNHLGWIRRIVVDGEDRLPTLLQDDRLLRHLYPAELFHPVFLRTLGMLPTEYLLYYYNSARALANQKLAGVTRGEELLRMNREVVGRLETLRADGQTALAEYRRYLNRRNGSYMRLEGAGESASAVPESDWNPFDGATGYHRIAVSAIAALSGARPEPLILNVLNHNAIAELNADDVIEAPCVTDENGPRVLALDKLSDSIRPLILSVKHFERMTIEAAVKRDRELAICALMSNPIVTSWDIAERYVNSLGEMLFVN